MGRVLIGLAPFILLIHNRVVLEFNRNLQPTG